jgi:hypothetical protein
MNAQGGVVEIRTGTALIIFIITAAIDLDDDLMLRL